MLFIWASHPTIFQDGDAVSKAETPEVAAMSQLQRDIQQQLEDEQQRRENKQRELELLGWRCGSFMKLIHVFFLEATNELGDGEKKD